MSAQLQISWEGEGEARKLRLERHGRAVTVYADDLPALRRALRQTGKHKAARRDYSPQVVVLLAVAEKQGGTTMQELIELIELPRSILELIVSRCAQAGLLAPRTRPGGTAGVRWTRAWQTTQLGKRWNGTPTIHPRQPIDDTPADPAFD